MNAMRTMTFMADDYSHPAPVGAIGPGPKASRRRGDRDDRRRGGDAVARDLAARSGRSKRRCSGRSTKRGQEAPLATAAAAAGGPGAAAHARAPPCDAHRPSGCTAHAFLDNRVMDGQHRLLRGDAAEARGSQRRDPRAARLGSAQCGAARGAAAGVDPDRARGADRRPPRRPPCRRPMRWAGTRETGPIRQNVDLAALQAETGLRLLPLVLLQTDRTGWRRRTARPPRRQPPTVCSDTGHRPAVDVHKHYGYAFQWFALAALILGLYVWFQVLAPYRAGRAARATKVSDEQRDA